MILEIGRLIFRRPFPRHIRTFRNLPIAGVDLDNQSHDISGEASSKSDPYIYRDIHQSHYKIEFCVVQSAKPR